MRILPSGLTKIKDFVRVNPDKKLFLSNFFVNSALGFSNAEYGIKNIPDLHKIAVCLK
jgi:hypothetical protein